MTPGPGRYVEFLWRRRRAVVGVSIALIVGFGLIAQRLELRPSFTELLPENAQSVKDLRRISKRMVSTDLLIVAIEGPERARNAKAADAIAAEIAKLPPRLVARVKHRLDEERAFFEKNKWLYPDLADLATLRDGLEIEIAKKKNPLFVSLDDDEPFDPKAIEKKYQDRVQEIGRFSSGYVANAEGDLFVVLTWPPDTAATEGSGEELSVRVRDILSRLDPERTWGAKATLAGNIETSRQERGALVDDLVLASGVCATLVLGVILLYYRRVRALAYVGFPALVGVAAAFAFAEVAFGGLNMSTAFLGSIILGNGINFPIIFASRYAEEARLHEDVREAVTIALRQTMLPTLVAASAASVAYGSLMLTDFRGFSQFGAIGGVGMLLCWTASVTSLPALIMLWEGRPGAVRMTPPGRTAFSGPAAFLIRRAPAVVVVVGALLTVAAILPIPAYLRDPLEHDFRKLRNRKTLTSGLARVTKSVDKLFGRALTPAVVLADRPDQVPEIKRRLFEQDLALNDKQVLETVETIDSLLPGTPEVQREKIAVLGEIRGLLDDPGFKLLDDEDRARIMEMRPPDGLRPIGVLDLPVVLRRRFEEKDGTLGRILFLYPKDSYSAWRGPDVIRFARATRTIRLASGEVIHSSSNAVITADMVTSVLRDGPRATLFSFLAVALLVVALTRSARGTAMVAGSLCAGVLWMVGGIALVREKVNFLNFIALPITFGIGVDYAVNVYARYRAEGRGSMAHAVQNAGGAVVLCSATTITGYAALLVADNRGLVSFGSLAILGEFACLATGVLLMPAIKELLDRRACRGSPPAMDKPGGDAVA
ncbi:MAG: MMPL family transporter [Myxococcota bacterium]